MKGRFVVDLSGLDLDEDRIRTIEKSIHSSILDAIADLRPRKDVSFRFPWEWYGLIATFDPISLSEIDKQIPGRIEF